MYELSFQRIANGAFEFAKDCDTMEEAVMMGDFLAGSMFIVNYKVKKREEKVNASKC